MKLAFRIAGVVCLVLASWWWFARTSHSASVSAVAPAAKEIAATPVVAPVELPVSSARAPIEAPSTNDSRAATPTPEPLAVAKEASVSSTGLLRVHVFSRETRKSLAGERITLRPKGVEHWSWRDIAGAHAAFREAPLTDLDGKAEIEIEPDHELTVFVGEHQAREPLIVAALSAGETRELDIDLPTETDLTLFGRLVDADTSLPIANGAVWGDQRSGFVSLGSHGANFSPAAKVVIPDDATRSQSDGTFEMHVRSWEQKFANAGSDNYSHTVFAIDASHATPESAIEVRLSRAATVELVVLDKGRAAAKVDVVLTTESYHVQQSPSMLNFYMSEDPRWTAQTDASGRAEVGDLPPRVPLALSVRVGRTVRTEGERLTLEPGERREIEIALGSGATIAGRVESGSGAPVASCPMWLVADQGSKARLLRDFEVPVATAFADTQGRFQFEDVTPGSWLVGPRPQSRREAESKTSDAIAALAQLIVIDANSRQVEVVVRVDAGLYLRGTVLDPSGTPVAKEVVFANSDNAWINENTDEEGRFTLGPVPSGSYMLSAGSFHGRYARSESAHATAGDSAIILRLRVGGAIHGRVVDAKGEARACELTLANEVDEAGSMSTATRDGKVSFDGLIPATYTLSAKTSDGLCGRRSGLVVRAGETIENVDIALEPGARVRLRYDGAEPFGQYQILVAGIPCGADGLEPGKVSVVVVPAGEIEVRWNFHDPKTMHSQKVTLRAGEEREVVWDGKP